MFVHTLNVSKISLKLLNMWEDNIKKPIRYKSTFNYNWHTHTQPHSRNHMHAYMRARENYGKENSILCTRKNNIKSDIKALQKIAKGTSSHANKAFGINKSNSTFLSHWNLTHISNASERVHLIRIINLKPL